MNELLILLSIAINIGTMSYFLIVGVVDYHRDGRHMDLIVSCSFLVLAAFIALFLAWYLWSGA